MKRKMKTTKVTATWAASGDDGGSEWLWERKQVGIGGDVGVEIGLCEYNRND